MTLARMYKEEARSACTAMDEVLLRLAMNDTHCISDGLDEIEIGFLKDRGGER